MQLHGRSCKKAKQTLQQLFDVPLDQLETSHPNVSLCKDCEKCLASIGRLTIQLQNFCSQVLQKLRAYIADFAYSVGKAMKQSFPRAKVTMASNSNWSSFKSCISQMPCIFGSN